MGTCCSQHLPASSQTVFCFSVPQYVNPFLKILAWKEDVLFRQVVPWARSSLPLGIPSRAGMPEPCSQPVPSSAVRNINQNGNCGLLMLQEFGLTNVRCATKPSPSAVPWSPTLRRFTACSSNTPTNRGEINCTCVKTAATRAPRRRTCTCTLAAFTPEALSWKKPQKNSQRFCKTNWALSCRGTPKMTTRMSNTVDYSGRKEWSLHVGLYIYILFF